MDNYKIKYTVKNKVFYTECYATSASECRKKFVLMSQGIDAVFCDCFITR